MLRFSRHARNRIRWIGRAEPDVTQESIRAALGEHSRDEYDERGNLRTQVVIGTVELTVVIDEEDALVPLYTYDSEADVLYILLVEEPDAEIAETIELSPTLHVDVNGDGEVTGIEVLFPRSAMTCCVA